MQTYRVKMQAHRYLVLAWIADPMETQSVTHVRDLATVVRCGATNVESVRFRAADRTFGACVLCAWVC